MAKQYASRLSDYDKTKEGRLATRAMKVLSGDWYHQYNHIIKVENDYGWDWVLEYMNFRIENKIDWASF